jgi:hypothetical protein
MTEAEKDKMIEQQNQAIEILNKRIEFKDTEIAALQATVKDLLTKCKGD